MNHSDTHGRYRQTGAKHSLNQTLVVSLLVVAAVVGTVVALAVSELALAFLAGAATAAVGNQLRVRLTTVAKALGHRGSTARG